MANDRRPARDDVLRDSLLRRSSARRPSWRSRSSDRHGPRLRPRKWGEGVHAPSGKTATRGCELITQRTEQHSIADMRERERKASWNGVWRGPQGPALKLRDQTQCVHLNTLGAFRRKQQMSNRRCITQLANFARRTQFRDFVKAPSLTVSYGQSLTGSSSFTPSTPVYWPFCTAPYDRL